jgi:hypothetical protein
MNGSLSEAGTAAESVIKINENENENEVKEIIQSIQEAQYFDASSMAPLTPQALVSLSYVLDKHT